jgi:hypothetical protein
MWWPRLVWLMALGASGCAIAPQSSRLQQKVEAARRNPDELRIEVRALAARFSGLLETMTEEMAAARPADARLRGSMTRLRANSVPAMQSALFKPDPVAALIDAWVLLAQLDALVIATVDQEPLRGIARRRIGVMETEVERIWGDLAGADEVAPARQRVYAFANAHPPENDLVGRQSTAALLAPLVARGRDRPLATASTLVREMQDLTARLDVQTTYLPRQARWQAQTLMLDALNDPSLRRAASEVTAQIAETKAFVSSERQALVDHLRGESDHAFDRATVLIDRIFVRLLLLVALMIAGGLLALQLVLSARRRRPG